MLNEKWPISAGSADIGKPLCLYDQAGDPIALMNSKRADKELIAIDIVKAVNSYDDLLEVLKALVSDVREYERINNLAPSPGKKDCWQSVTGAEAAIAKAEGKS